MTLSKINSNLQTNQTWRGVVDAGIDQINTNTTAIASNATNIASNDTDIATNVTNIASNLTKITSLEETVLTADKTVTIAAGSTYAQIQTLINGQPKDLNGHTLTVQFTSGTTASPEVYDFGSEDLNIRGFHGGTLTVGGVADESSTATGTVYKTKIRSTRDNWQGLFNIDDCNRVEIKSLQLDLYGTTTGQVAVRTQNSDVNVFNCRFTYSGTGTPNVTNLYVVGVNPLNSSCEVVNNQFDKMSFCLFAERGSKVFADNSVSFGTTPLRGYQASKGAIITPDGTVPNANVIYVASEGALITNKSGLVLEKTVLTADTTVTITQSGGESTTQCVVTGYTSATFNASDYSNDAAQTIQAAISSLPKNINGYDINLIFGTESGQTITISNDIEIGDFTGGSFYLRSGKVADRSNDSAIKANKIQSSGTSIDRIFEIARCSEVYIQGLELRQTTGTGSGYIVVASSVWVDINHSVLTANYSTHQQTMRGLLSQRGATTWFRDSWVNNVSVGIVVGNMATACQLNASWTGTQPVTGMQAQAGIGILNSTSIIEGSSADYSASTGGLITNKNGLVLEETILTASKTINLDNSMSVTEIQNIINDQPKQLNGNSLIFQFADGNYDFISGGISFNGFDGGYLDVQGNLNNTDVENLSVKFHGDQASNSGLVVFVNCSARCHLFKISLEQDSTSVTQQRSLRFISVAHGLVNSCSFNSLSTNRANEGIFANDGRTRINNCKFNNLEKAIYSVQNSTHSYNNREFTGGTAPDSGLVGIEGSIITQENTQINGHTNDTFIASGSVITNKNGLILGETILTATKTVNFDNSMSVTTMQGLINDQPKNLNGYDLTFQFADGTYDFGTSALSFGQFEGGTLLIKGKANETPNAAGGGMSVIIRSQNTGDSGALYFQKCVRAVVTNIRFEQTGSNTDTILVRFFYNTYGKVQNSSFVNVNGTQNNVAVYYFESTGLVQGCKFNNFNNNVSGVVNSRVCSRNSATFSGSGSDQDSTNNIRSESGSIVTQSGTQSGGAATKNDGGIIFSTTGTVV